MSINFPFYSEKEFTPYNSPEYNSPQFWPADCFCLDSDNDQNPLETQDEKIADVFQENFSSIDNNPQNYFSDIPNTQGFENHSFTGNEAMNNFTGLPNTLFPKLSSESARIQNFEYKDNSKNLPQPTDSSLNVEIMSPQLDVPIQLNLHTQANSLVPLIPKVISPLENKILEYFKLHTYLSLNQIFSLLKFNKPLQTLQSILDEMKKKNLIVFDNSMYELVRIPPKHIPPKELIEINVTKDFDPYASKILAFLSSGPAKKQVILDNLGLDLSVYQLKLFKHYLQYLKRNRFITTNENKEWMILLPNNKHENISSRESTYLNKNLILQATTLANTGSVKRKRDENFNVQLANKRPNITNIQDPNHGSKIEFANSHVTEITENEYIYYKNLILNKEFVNKLFFNSVSVKIEISTLYNCFQPQDFRTIPIISRVIQILEMHNYFIIEGNHLKLHPNFVRYIENCQNNFTELQNAPLLQFTNQSAQDYPYPANYRENSIDLTQRGELLIIENLSSNNIDFNNYRQPIIDILSSGPAVRKTIIEKLGLNLDPYQAARLSSFLSFLEDHGHIILRNGKWMIRPLG